MLPRLMQIVGFLLIIVSVFVGFTSYEVDLEGYGEVEKSFAVLFTWIGAGTTSGLLLVGVGEIIHKLEDVINK